MEIKIVLGHAFGDEGKGVTVQWLCKQALAEGKSPCVVRFSGGPQSAHTVVNGGVEHICSSFGSGVLLDVPTLYVGDAYIDPICVLNERNVLEQKGITPSLYIGSMGNRIITPYDVIAGRNNAKVRTDGTCGKGLYATYMRKKNYFVFFTHDFYVPEATLLQAAEYHGLERNKELDQKFMEGCEYLREHAGDGFMSFDVLIFEGTQGLLLDMDCGFYPHVTPSRVGLNGVPEKWLKDAELYLVTRTYTTRHGNGYTPECKLPYDLSKKHETNVYNEYQGAFKVGALEIPLLNSAYERHCIDNYVRKYNIKTNLVITHVDVVADYGGMWYQSNSGQLHYLDDGTPDAVSEAIVRNLNYKPNHVFCNDSVESKLQQVR